MNHKTKNHKMPQEEPTHPFFDQYVEGDAIKQFPFFYRHLEPYMDDTTIDVEDVNLVTSEFHQSMAHAIGFFHKKASQVHLTSKDLIYKQR